MSHDDAEAQAERDLSRRGSDDYPPIDRTSAESSSVEQFVSSVRLIQFARKSDLAGKRSYANRAGSGSGAMALLSTDDGQRRVLVDHQAGQPREFHSITNIIRISLVLVIETPRTRC